MSNGTVVLTVFFFYFQEVIMNYLKLKQKIYEAIERNPLDRSAYEEMFCLDKELE